MKFGLRSPSALQRPHGPTAIGIACGVGASLGWAIGFVGVRHGIDAGFSPIDLTLHRFLWSGLAALPFVVRCEMRSVNGIAWGRALCLTVFGGPCFVLISNSGYLLAPLGHGGVIQPSSATLGGLCLATVWLRERLVPARAIGAVILVFGVGVIGTEAALSIGTHGVVGDFAFVLAGLMFATFGTLLRLWRISATSAVTATSVLALLMLPAYGLSGGTVRMLSLGWRENVIQAVLQGMLAGPVAVYLFARSVNLLGGARAAIFPSSVPPFVVLIGWAVLGEAPTSLQIAGLVIVLFGFRVAQRG